jgi:hypothetical protein
VAVEDDIVKKRYQNRKLAIQLGAPVMAFGIFVGGIVALNVTPDFKERCVAAGGTWVYEKHYDEKENPAQTESCTMPNGEVDKPE